ncbi:hypothetical protein BC827DRAFT_1226821 [Russula dissimulans]|nr:hypothetical protein BC827DRAFT_1226821 [Russula dissimulans]
MCIIHLFSGSVLLLLYVPDLHYLLTLELSDNALVSIQKEDWEISPFPPTTFSKPPMPQSNSHYVREKPSGLGQINVLLRDRCG